MSLISSVEGMASWAETPFFKLFFHNLSHPVKETYLCVKANKLLISNISYYGS